MKKRFNSLAVFLCALFFTGCAATRVARLEIDEQVDLSGYWNDTDSRLVADEMTSDCLSGAWLNRFSSKSGKNPKIIVGNMVNSSSEHIATDTFVKDIERAIINSGKAGFVASGSGRNDIRNERADQQKFS